MPSEILQTPWQTAAILIGRLIFAAVFLMAVAFKFMDMGATAGYIAAAGFP
ncbi:MAG: DoxX family protein, partial [Mesorhizobium sp.]